MNLSLLVGNGDVSVADGKIISYQLWAMQNYSDNFIYQNNPKIYFFDDAV